MFSKPSSLQYAPLNYLSVASFLLREMLTPLVLSVAFLPTLAGFHHQPSAQGSSSAEAGSPSREPPRVSLPPLPANQVESSPPNEQSDEDGNDESE